MRACFSPPFTLMICGMPSCFSRQREGAVAHKTLLVAQCHTEQLRLLATQGRPLELSRVFTLCQRLVEDTERVGEEGGGKLSSSRTATPTLLRRVNMHEAATHLLLRGLYFSMELRLELPSLPPTAYSQPSMATRS